jgi:hypothetical protein
MCKDCWFSKYNRVLLHYSVSIGAAEAAAALAYIPLSAAAAAVAVVAYIPLSSAAAAAQTVKEERRVLRDVFNMPRM